MKYSIIIAALLAGTSFMANAQQAKPEDTEVWTPEPKVVTPGTTCADAPSDAVILFDGKNLDQWVQADDQSPAKWDVHDGILTVNKKYGNIETKQKFTNYQLHIEWKEPSDLEGTGQARGNSGVFLASLGKGDAGYELQVLDAYKNKTYVNGMAGSLYKQAIPLANPARPNGVWQTYDVIWTAPPSTMMDRLKRLLRLRFYTTALWLKIILSCLGLPCTSANQFTKPMAPLQLNCRRMAIKASR